MLNWMLWTKNDFKVYHRQKVNAPSNMKLVTSLMNFKCQPCGIFEGLSYHQEDEVIDPTIFAATVGLGYRIKKLVYSNLHGHGELSFSHLLHWRYLLMFFQQGILCEF